jgi:drug/metabolite transporter (DMT)-like permease
MDTHTKGVYLAFAAALISGLAVFFNKFAVSFWDSSSVFTTAKNLIAAVLLTSLILLIKKLPELKKLSSQNWIRLIMIGFIGGSVPFLLFFKGLSLTQASNAAFIHKTLFIWIALLALPILKEKLSYWQVLALIILAVGAYLFVSPAKWQFGYGEFLVLLATLLWAVENVIAKITLRNIPSLVVAWGRMFFGSVFLMIYLFFIGQFTQLFVFSGSNFSWLLLSGVILFGYVATWYAALKYAPATVVSAILVIAAPITALLDSIFVTDGLKASLILPILLIILGALLVSRIFEKVAELIKTKRAAAISL